VSQSTVLMYLIMGSEEVVVIWLITISKHFGHRTAIDYEIDVYFSKFFHKIKRQLILMIE